MSIFSITLQLLRGQIEKKKFNIKVFDNHKRLHSKPSKIKFFKKKSNKVQLSLGNDNTITFISISTNKKMKTFVHFSTSVSSQTLKICTIQSHVIWNISHWKLQENFWLFQPQIKGWLQRMMTLCLYFNTKILVKTCSKISVLGIKNPKYPTNSHSKLYMFLQVYR